MRALLIVLMLVVLAGCVKQPPRQYMGTLQVHDAGSASGH